MARTATSRPGKTEGYVLLEGAIALLLSVAVAASVLPAMGQALRASQAALERSRSGLEAWNERVTEDLDELAP